MLFRKKKLETLVFEKLLLVAIAGVIAQLPFGHDPTGRYAVDADAHGPELTSQRSRKSENAGFRRVVEGERRQAEKVIRGRDVDDSFAVAGVEKGQRGLRSDEEGTEVNGDQAVEILDRCFLECNPRVYRSIIHEVVNMAAGEGAGTFDESPCFAGTLKI